MNEHIMLIQPREKQLDHCNVYNVVKGFFVAIDHPVDDLLLKTIAESIDKGLNDVFLVDDLEEEVYKALNEYESEYGSYRGFSLPKIFKSISNMISAKIIDGGKIDLQDLSIDSCWMDLLVGLIQIQSSTEGDKRRRMVFTTSCVFMHQLGQLYKNNHTILEGYDSILKIHFTPIGEGSEKKSAIENIRHALTHNDISIQGDIVVFTNKKGKTRSTVQIDDFINGSLLVAESVKERNDGLIPEWIRKLANDLCCICEGEVKRPCSWEMFMSTLELFYESVHEEFEKRKNIFSKEVEDGLQKFIEKKGKAMRNLIAHESGIVERPKCDPSRWHDDIHFRSSVEKLAILSNYLRLILAMPLLAYCLLILKSMIYKSASIRIFGFALRVMSCTREGYYFPTLAIAEYRTFSYLS